VTKALTDAKKAVDDVLAKIDGDRANAATQAAKAAQSAKAKAKKVKIKKAIATKKRKAKVTWEKVSGINGYQLSYSTSKKFSKKKTKTVNVSARATKKILNKLKAGKKYYVRIRTYKVVYNSAKGANEIVYGKWSKKKGLKAKK
jgi:hypothetical protein